MKNRKLKKRLKKLKDRIKNLESQSVAVTDAIVISSEPLDAQKLWREISAERVGPYYYEEEEEVFKYNGYL